jgi:hypothetical protein
VAGGGEARCEVAVWVSAALARRTGTGMACFCFPTKQPEKKMVPVRLSCFSYRLKIFFL